ncbi:MAG: cation diffusion facilitator family transporter [Rudaea sp.]
MSAAKHNHHHDNHGHDQRHGEKGVARNETRLLIAFVLTFLAMLVEAGGGWLSGSLALLADAGHMLVDAFALLLAFAGAHFARRPADSRRSFGYARLEVLVGYTNALAQLALVAWIVVEAVSRLHAPEPIKAMPMLAIAVVGMLINLIVLGALGNHAHDDLNTAGARLHVIGDLLGSVGAVIAALLIAGFGWLWADAAFSILTAVLILHSAWRLLRRCAHILLEGTPDDLHAVTLVDALCQQVGVAAVHHVHVWQLASGSRIATLHARPTDGHDRDVVLATIQRTLRERFRIAHATIQLENSDCTTQDCADPAEATHAMHANR